MLPAYQELVAFYYTELLVYLGMARGYCENGMSNDKNACGYSPSNDQCCTDYQHMLEFEKGRLPEILYWIYGVKKKLKAVYSGWPLSSAEIARWEANFFEANIELMEG